MVDFSYNSDLKEWMRPGITSITEENSTHILTTDDVGKLIICNNVAGCEITVPANTLPLNSIFYPYVQEDSCL
jgi:hypothetical protein